MMVEEIKEIQRLLKALGFDPGPIDGKFDTKTQKAVMDFQGSKGLNKDGNVGRQTLAALKNQQCQAPPWKRPECQGGSN